MYARRGIDVHVCIVTDGGAGDCDPRVLAACGATTVAQLRTRELECACRELGVTLHRLGYRDSGMEGSAANKHPESLYQAGLPQVAAEIQVLMQELRPEVAVTHDPTGGYYHPDHIRVCQAATRAFAACTAPALQIRADAADGRAWRPERLYYHCIPRSQIMWVLAVLRLLRKDYRHFGANGDIDLSAVGVDDKRIHVRLDVSRTLDVKGRASACHASQGGGGRMPRFVPATLRRRWLGTEHFTQAQPPGAVRHRDLI